MMKVVSVQEIQEIEQHADAGGLSYIQMMHNAGNGIATWLLNHVDLKRGVIGLIGSGNNGGDTIIALDALSQRGVRTMGFLVKQRQKDDLLQGYQSSGGIVVDISHNKHLEALIAGLQSGMILLDGILGTGLKLSIRGDLANVMARISETVKKRSKGLIIAIDCPSGVDCDSGEVADVTIPTDITLCMAAIKQGLLKSPGRSYCGDFYGIDIGLSEETKQLLMDLPEMIDQHFVAKRLPARTETGHKGTYGTCQVIAGSRAFTGAPYLTGKAASLSGCGLVHVATIKDVYQNLSGQLIEAIWTMLPDIEGAYSINGVVAAKTGFAKADSLVIGPGLGFFHENAKFLLALLDVIPEKLPTLIDADGLNLLSELDNWWDYLPENTILTPHPGEMSKLTGLSINEIQSNRWQIAQEFAQKWGVVLVLKGAMTVVASPKAELFILPVSDSALATAGSGDVLAGVIGGLLAQGTSTPLAAACGVWLHAQAGLAAKTIIGTAHCVTALAILDYLPEAFFKLKTAGMRMPAV